MGAKTLCWLIEREFYLKIEKDLNKYNQDLAVDTTCVTLDDAMVNSDVFIGVSGR